MGKLHSKKSLLRFTIIPTLLACAIIVLGFLWINAKIYQHTLLQTETYARAIFFNTTSHLNQHLDQHTTTPASIIDQNIHISRTKHLLNEHPKKSATYLTVTFLDSSKTLVHQHGQQIDLERVKAKVGIDNTWIDTPYQHIVIAVGDRAAPLGWIIVTAQNTPKNLPWHFAAFIALAIFLLSLLRLSYWRKIFVCSPTNAFETTEKTKKTPDKSVFGSDTNESSGAKDLSESNAAIENTVKTSKQTSKNSPDSLSKISGDSHSHLHFINSQCEQLAKTDLTGKQKKHVKTIGKFLQSLLANSGNKKPNHRLKPYHTKTDKLPQKYKRLHLSSLVEKSAQLITTDLQKNQLQLLIDLNYDIPLNLRDNPNKIRQILDNLLTDIIGFTNPGYSHTLKTENILHEDQKIILKLSIHGGAIDHTKTAHTEITGDPAKEEPTTSQTTNRPATWHNTVALAVDDNPTNLHIVKELLNGIGVEVYTAKCGEQALAICQNTQLNIIFMDIHMPKMDGLETTKKLRKQENNNARTPVVALTAHTIDEYKTQLLLAGMDDYLSKPISQHDLIQMLERWTPNGLQNQRRANTQNIETALDTHANTNQVAKSSKAQSAQSKKARQTTTCDTNNKGEKNDMNIVDAAQSRSLARNNMDLAQDMFAMLLDSFAATKQDILQAQTQKNREQLREAAHKLYGGCCYCGVPDLKGSSKQLELASEKDTWEQINQAVATTLKDIDNIIGWAQEYDLGEILATHATLP